MATLKTGFENPKMDMDSKLRSYFGIGGVPLELKAKLSRRVITVPPDLQKKTKTNNLILSTSTPAPSKPKAKSNTKKWLTWIATAAAVCGGYAAYKNGPELKDKKAPEIKVQSLKP